MDKAKLPRRRSPLWVRELSDRACHGIAMKLRVESQALDLSPQQEWLWEALISELEYRRRVAMRRRFGSPCTCELCLGPFEEPPWLTQ